MKCFAAFLLCAIALLAQPVTPPRDKYPPCVPSALVTKAIQGDAVAMFDLSEYWPYCGKQDRGFWEDLAMRRLPAEIEKGNVEAMARLGYEYTRYSHIRENFAKGQELLRRAGDGGSLFGMIKFFKSFPYPENVENSEVGACFNKWWPMIKAKIDANDPEALYLVGKEMWSPLSLYNIGGVTREVGEAWLKKAALEFHHREALYSYGRYLRENAREPRERNLAFSCLEEAAEQGHWYAALDAAYMAAHQEVDIEGLAGWNPEASARVADELARLAEHNTGWTEDEGDHKKELDIFQYWLWRADPSAGEDSETEEDGSPIEPPAPPPAPVKAAPKKAATKPKPQPKPKPVPSTPKKQPAPKPGK